MKNNRQREKTLSEVLKEIFGLDSPYDEVVLSYKLKKGEAPHTDITIEIKPVFGCPDCGYRKKSNS